MKLYIVVRADLLSGAQAAQACHAITEFIIQHPEVAKYWHDISNHIVILNIRDEISLKDLLEKCKSQDLRCSFFLEPDRDNELTAIAIEPGKASQRLCSGLPLALKDYVDKKEPRLFRDST